MHPKNAVNRSPISRFSIFLSKQVTAVHECILLSILGGFADSDSELRAESQIPGNPGRVNIVVEETQPLASYGNDCIHPTRQRIEVDEQEQWG
jgi:hypothetical protein